MGSKFCQRNGIRSLLPIALTIFVIVFKTPPGASAAPAASADPEAFDGTGAIAIDNQFSISHSPVQYDFAVPDLALMNPQILRGNLEWVECVKDRIYGSRI